jgi:hypothetical protein
LCISPLLKGIYFEITHQCNNEIESVNSYRDVKDFEWSKKVSFFSKNKKNELTIQFFKHPSRTEKYKIALTPPNPLNEGKQYKSTPSLRATPQDGNWYNFSLIPLPSTRGSNTKTIPPRISYFVDGQLQQSSESHRRDESG